MIRVTIKDDDGKVIQSMTYQMDMTYPMEVMLYQTRKTMRLASSGMQKRKERVELTSSTL